MVNGIFNSILNMLIYYGIYNAKIMQLCVLYMNVYTHILLILFIHSVYWIYILPSSLSSDSRQLLLLLLFLTYSFIYVFVCLCPCPVFHYIYSYRVIHGKFIFPMLQYQSSAIVRPLYQSIYIVQLPSSVY